jgi:membrane fusion protein, multidrug efflux system
MKKFIVFILLGAALLVPVLLKIFANTRKEKPSLVQTGHQPVMAECMIAGNTLVELPFTAVGKTRANERVELVSEISGRLVSIHFHEGSRVKKGDLLFHLDDAEWIAELSKIQARLDLARETEERHRLLLESGGISRQVFDEITSQRRILEAEEQILRVRIEKANIRAPFDGFIGIRNVSEGAFLSPGTVLTVLEDLERLRLEFTVPEVYAAAIRQGDRVSFRAEGIPGLQEAVIRAYDPSVSEKTGNLRVLAHVEKPDPALRAGVAVSVHVRTASPAPAIYVPTQALVPIPGGYTVFALEDGKATVRKVTTGIRSDNRVEVVSGINPGDSILVTGFMRIRPGVPVKIVKVWQHEPVVNLH